MTRNLWVLEIVFLDYCFRKSGIEYRTITVYFGKADEALSGVLLKMSDENIEDTVREVYSEDDESYDMNESESATPSVNPVSNQLPNVGRSDTRERDNSEVLRVIVDALQRAVGTIPAITSTSTT
ncbi:hypothetical protein PVK06_007828 [Gossypium arboreum]|uniref:Uncharacterized protein n=1 Tax=Gossypium arboreum TaxID=29729 RepID=A0ABR0QIC2_GOSAR|nr:hypothetical protein PVK06_007828 [Gossypium arboreum]